MRVLAIDYGGKRIGLAIGDTSGKQAFPLTTIDACGDQRIDAQRVLEHARNYDYDAFVVGLPLNMDDTEGRQAKVSRGFAKVLAELSGKPVHFWDERLSSLAADELLGATDLTRGKRKARRDRIAAQIILQEFLDAQPIVKSEQEA